MKLSWIITKFGTRICLYTPYKCTKFQPDQNTRLRVRADFMICAKRRRRRIRKKTKKETETLLTCISEMAYMI